MQGNTALKLVFIHSTHYQCTCTLHVFVFACYGVKASSLNPGISAFFGSSGHLYFLLTVFVSLFVVAGT